MKKNLFFILVFFIFTSLSAQNLVINEFMASNDYAAPDEYGDFDDWIEIFNADTLAIDIGGMYITDDLTNPTAWQIPTTDPGLTTILPGGFLVLWADKEPDQGVLHVNLKLSGGGEQIGLYASDGVTEINSLTYEEQTTDVSYGRLPDGSDNWIFFGKHDIVGYISSPGRSNITIKVNEFLASNDATNADENGDFDDWVELYNYGPVDIDITGMFLSDDIGNVTSYAFPPAVISSGGYLLVWCDKSDEDPVTDPDFYHSNFKLSASGEAVIFSEYENTIVDAIFYGEQQTDISYGRYPDGTDEWAFFAEPTPDATNDDAVSVGDEQTVAEYKLFQNYPNPFNPSTTIKFTLPEANFVSLKVFNMLGEEVADVINSELPQGVHNVNFNASDLSSGIYLYSIKAGGFVQTRKMLLLK
ncbi:MAG: T9SS type A sorting domain-containing protein [Chlorobi bacterium]|nr:T9SS type A sorting domain-containing protein [Chlorobiota bacterium]